MVLCSVSVRCKIELHRFCSYCNCFTTDDDLWSWILVCVCMGTFEHHTYLRPHLLSGLRPLVEVVLMLVL